MKSTIVYSALHTGTWFTCNILQCTKESTVTRSDSWIKTEIDKTIEQALVDGKYSTLNRLIREQIKKKNDISNETTSFVLQAHQREDSYFFKNIMQIKPEIPIIVPIRDPLLSINTRIWREAGTIEALELEPKPKRRHRVNDQLNSFKRLLSLPDNHVLKYCIDLPYSNTEKVRIFNNIIEYANLTKDNDKIKEEATKWIPVNKTANGNYPQKRFHDIRDKEFMIIKEQIQKNNIEEFKKYMDFELQIIRDELADYRSKLKQLGYKELCWW